jgi:hypothetical protein
VTDGDTLVSVATGPGSVVADPEILKSFNLDTLYGRDFKLYPGQHLRLPIHNCFEDEANECYIVRGANETLQSIAKIYDMTAETLCKANTATFGRNYCDPALEPLPKLLVGMELTVSRLYPDPPSPCKEIPGYWTCYSVQANDTLLDVIEKGTAGTYGSVDIFDVVEINWGENASLSCGNCSNVTQCPLGAGSYPQCLAIGQVLTLRVNTCVPKPGVWRCFSPFAWDEFDGRYWDGLGGKLTGKVGDPERSSPLNLDFFCKANRHSIPACRKENLGTSSPLAPLISSLAASPPPRPNQKQEEEEVRWVKAPYFNCIPNDKSYCRSSTGNSTAGNWAEPVLTTNGGPLVVWDGNAVPFGTAKDRASSYFSEYKGYEVADYYIPRGSLPGDALAGCARQVPVAQCTPVPGKYLCHKPLAPRWGDPEWTDTIDQIASRFGVDPNEVCKLSQLANCSVFCQFSAFKIPVTQLPRQPPSQTT